MQVLAGRALALTVVVGLVMPVRALFGGCELEVKYSGVAANGGLMTMNATARKPSLFFAGAQEGAMYTVIMVDPDAPDPANATCKWYGHWILQNATGTNLTGLFRAGFVYVSNLIVICETPCEIAMYFPTMMERHVCRSRCDRLLRT